MNAAIVTRSSPTSSKNNKELSFGLYVFKYILALSNFVLKMPYLLTYVQEVGIRVSDSVVYVYVFPPSEENYT